MPNITDTWPVYGKHYREGYFGFSFTRNSLVSNGIALATNLDVKSGFEWSHVFIVESQDTILEATSPRVCRSPLSKYTCDIHTEVAFRRPRHWSPTFAEHLISECRRDIGLEYDTPLLAAHLINKLTFGLLKRRIARLFDAKRKWICSEWAAAKLLSVRPGWANLPKSILRNPPNTINPQQLFENNTLWDLWTDTGYG
jgi:hypothetical protein